MDQNDRLDRLRALVLRIGDRATATGRIEHDDNGPLLWAHPYMAPTVRRVTRGAISLKPIGRLPESSTLVTVRGTWDGSTLAAQEVLEIDELPPQTIVPGEPVENILEEEELLSVLDAGSKAANGTLMASGGGSNGPILSVRHLTPQFLGWLSSRQAINVSVAVALVPVDE